MCPDHSWHLSALARAASAAATDLADRARRLDPPSARRAWPGLALAPLLLAPALVAAQPAARTGASDQAQQVEVVGTSPLAGLGVDRNLLPYASHTVRRGSLDAAQADNLTDFLARRLPGMQVNDVQGSPFQGDLSFRGYRASGLLGAPQGLSVYLDGVRINEAFGDVVNWDLVPEFALAGITVTPAANPAFGLNTLGGALALSTLDGLSAPGLQAELRFGSHGRRQASASLGQRHADGWHSWVGASGFAEQGWRDHSRGEQALALATLGRRQGPTDWRVSVLGGRATLIGNGLLPAYTLDGEDLVPDLYLLSRRAVFSHPDRTRNTVGQLRTGLTHRLAPELQAEALAYVRDSRRATVNGDVADDTADPDENAALNTTRTRQRAAGLAASLSGRHGMHRWQVGASFDRARVRYQQDEQEGAFDAGRGVIAGSEPAEPSADVRGHSRQWGVYATDTWQLAPGSHLTATLRYNHARVGNTLTTRDDDSGLLEAKPPEAFTYRSLNPAIGLAQALSPALTVFANVARNTRVPTVIELGCADPAEPCRLPAGLQSDPYLKPVRATSLEAGARWQPAPGQRLELSLYRTDNRDDILFSSVSATGQLGYFRNFDRTRHQGAELSWTTRLGPVGLQAALTHLDATYQAHGSLRQGERNVTIAPGTRIAGLPRWTGKLAADWRPNPAWQLGLDWQLSSHRGVQGNEDGLLEDGEDDAVRLRIPGHGLLNLRAAWTPRPGMELTLRITNLFDKRYESFGALGETVFDARGRYTGVERQALFVAPGAPRSVFAGLRLSY